MTTFNWKPIVYTGLLLATKFWEDINVWNIDYVETLEGFSLTATRNLESQFLSLCKFEMLVTAELYAEYFFAIRAKSLSNVLDIAATIEAHGGEELKRSLIKYKKSMVLKDE